MWRGPGQFTTPALAALGDVKAFGNDVGGTIEALQIELMRLQFALPEPDPIPLPGWFKRIGLPTGPRMK